MAATVPSCIAYDPTYAYQLAVIVQDGMRRMFTEQENVFYYITVTNENYVMPEMPTDAEEGIVRGHVSAARSRPQGPESACSCSAAARSCARCWPGPRARGGLRGQAECLERDELHRAHARRRGGAAPQPPAPESAEGAELRRALPRGRATARWSRPPTTCGCSAIRSARFVPRRYVVLGTDGFGRSDVRPQPAPPLRGRSPLGGACGAERAGGRRRVRPRSRG